MPRLARTLLLAATALCLAAPSASAAAPRPVLEDFWTTVLELPAADNPFATGEPACVDLGGNTVAPLIPFGAPSNDVTCTVRRGTKIFVSASTWECSTFAGDHPDFGTTEAELRECARQNDDEDPPVAPSP